MAVEISPKRKVRNWRGLLINILRLVLLFGFLAAWELASGTLIRSFLISSPTKIAKLFWELTLSGELAKHTWITLKEIVIGYVIGCALGFVVAFMLGRSKLLAEVFEPFILAFYGVPRIALAPLFIIWLGIGIWSKVGVVVTVTFFLIFFNVYAGLKNLQQEYVDLGRLMGANEWTILFRIIIPSISPFVIVGLKICIPQAIIGAVVGEFIVAMGGLGYMVRRSAELMDTPGLFVGVFVLLLVVLVGNGILNRLEKMLIRWKNDDEIRTPA